MRNTHAATRAALLPAVRHAAVHAPLRAAPAPLAAPRRRCAPARLRRATAARSATVVCTLAAPLLSAGTDGITMSHADFDVAGRRVPARAGAPSRARRRRWSSVPLACAFWRR
jgi:hypothetical protein